MLKGKAFYNSKSIDLKLFCTPTRSLIYDLKHYVNKKPVQLKVRQVINTLQRILLV